MRSLTVLLLGLVVGCGVDGQMMGLEGETDGGRSDTGMAPQPDTAGQQPDTGSTVKMDTAPASPDTQKADTAPAAQLCAQWNDTHYTGCGLLEGDQSWRSKWKDGLACAVCNYRDAPVLGCTVNKRPDTQVEGNGPVLCVQACGECCWKKVGSSCDTNADCCSPLTCKSSGSGSGKTCQ